MEAIVNPAVVRGARAAAAPDSLGARILTWLRRRVSAQKRAAEAPLHAEARLNLGPRKSLVLVNCCGRRLLVGLSGDNMVLLGEWPQARARRESRASRGGARTVHPRSEAAQ
ncbi:MAG TPA: flagellar biosynthetic protein FliO [Acidobacteriaceae bacterium]|nr:flagellar biosynthetic protein FliO [Acidobacteriaceae bacterium]